MYLLAIIGTLMLLEGASEIDRARKKIVLKKKITYPLLDSWTTFKIKISQIKTL